MNCNYCMYRDRAIHEKPCCECNSYDKFEKDDKFKRKSILLESFVDFLADNDIVFYDSATDCKVNIKDMIGDYLTETERRK